MHYMNWKSGLASLVLSLVLAPVLVRAVVAEREPPPFGPQRAYLVPGESPSEAEAAAFQVFLEQFSARSEQDDFSAAMEFLGRHPQGVWAPPLRLRLAEEFYNTGWYSRAIETLERLWGALEGPSGAAEAVVRTRAGVHLAELYARLGRVEDLERVIRVLDGAPLPREELEIFRGVKAGFEVMRARPEAARRCGALALERIRVFSHTTNSGHPTLMTSRSSIQGMSLAEVEGLARAVGMEYQAAFRSPGAPLVTPAVMHLRIGHYVALLRTVQGKVHLEDPTGWQSTYASRAAIEGESSGYFLVPAGPLPPGWRAVEGAEAATVFGRNGVLENDPDATTKRDPRSKCGGSSYGMASWDLHLMLVSQQVVDTPIRYQPPVGPPIEVTFRQTQRANQRFGYKPRWTHNWSGQVFENPRALLGDLWLQEEGGWERLSALDEEGQAYQGRIFNTGRFIRPDRNTLVWIFPDGSRNTYTTFSGPEVTWGRVFYLSAVTDPAGNTVTIQVQASGRVESVTDPLGRVTRFFYELGDPGLPPRAPNQVLANRDYSQQVTRVTDPFGRSAVLHYAKVERAIATLCEGPDGPFSCPIYYYDYDLTNITDVAGMSSQFAYDATGTLITHLTTPYGTTRFDWSGAFGGAMQVTDPEGETERFEFAQYGRNLEEPLWRLPAGMRTDGGGYEVRHWDKKAFAESYRPDSAEGATIYLFQSSDTWASAGRGIMAIKPPLENPVWYNYPEQGAAALPGVGLQPARMGRVLDDGSTQLWQTQRDPWGNLIRHVDPLGRTTRYVYAPNGIDLLEGWQSVGNREELLFRNTWTPFHLPATVTDGAGQTTRYAYNARGQLLSVTNPRNESTSFAYDANGYLTAVDGPLPGTQDRKTFTRDAVGRIRTAADADGYSLTFEYDALDRVTRVTFPDGTAETLTYDRMDVAVARDRLGRETRLSYDGLRRVTAVQDPLGRVTRYQWCGCGDLSAVIDPLGRMTQWRRDLQGRVIAKEYADGSSVVYEHEAATSRVRRMRDELNQVTEFTYSLANELLAKRYVGALKPTPDVSFTWDSYYPRVATRTDGAGVTSYSYHPVNGQVGAGLLALEDGPWANDQIAYAYDVLGRVTQRSINGAVVNWTFDAAGRLSNLSNPLGSFSHTWEEGSRRLSSVTYPNGQRSDYAYLGNAGDRLLQRITHSLAGGAKLSEFTYTYDAGGRVTQWGQLQAGRTRTWTPGYDPADRLTSLVETVPSQPSGQYGWSYDAADNLTSETVGGRRRDFSHNALNQLAEYTAEGSPAAGIYEWDAEQRLVAINHGSRRSEFVYDGLDRVVRMVEREGANVLSDRRYVWSGLSLAEERDATGGTTLKRYSYYGVQNLAAPELPVGNHFFTRDHLGSIRELGNTTFEYSPYGELKLLSGSAPTDFAFTGHFQHRPTSLLLAPFRAYHPAFGRWLNRDPLGEAAALNLYAYVEGDPINQVDPLGLYSMADLSQDWQSVKDWAGKNKEAIKKYAKKIFYKTKAGKEVKKFDDFDTDSEKILDTELEIKEALDDPDCGHSGAKLLRTMLNWIPKSIQLGPLNNADLFRKTLDEGVKNVDYANDIREQRYQDAIRNERN